MKRRMRVFKQHDVLAEQLAEARQRISLLEAELAKAASRDSLTHAMLTLRTFRVRLDHETQRARRYRRPLSVVLVDIGKVGVPDEILHKEGPLDEREWEVMRQHPIIGERILRAIPGLGGVARIVRHEHERWDGGGYPEGLSGEDIPLGSRVILACDTYHAMTSDPPYRAAMPHAAAAGELTRNAGSQFDVRVVEALVGYLYGRRQAGRPAAGA